ncbi:nucleotidyl transferase AbiEii/AbiGii toxin family protein [Candidatus Roizmanbacteria bacterium]|nr:nucleotidyl transferase AbiEii/AbiGii toxin family protein [Candidatus Roizmanbacteria bacterium]
MKIQVLNDDQKELLPFIKSFSSDFYLVGGTAVALHLGHRRSIDFDLFTDSSFDPVKFRNRINSLQKIGHTFSQGEGELTVLVRNVKLTFFHYPFKIEGKTNFDDTITMPDLITLGSMKAFALGRRAKWKDYVDLYFILKRYSFTNLMNTTKNIFKNEFNEKLFRTQLAYFDDIDYSETIDYMEGFKRNDDEIKNYLEEISLSK